MITRMVIETDDGNEYYIWPSESYPDEYADMQTDRGTVITGDELTQRVIAPATKLLLNLSRNYVADVFEPHNPNLG